MTRTIPGRSTFQRLALHLYCIFGKLHQHTAYWETWETGTGEGLGGTGRCVVCAGKDRGNLSRWLVAICCTYVLFDGGGGIRTLDMRFGADHDSRVSKPLV